VDFHDGQGRENGLLECARAISPSVAVQAKAHAGGELERHTFEDTNGREDCKQIYPPQEFPNFLEIAREMPRW